MNNSLYAYRISAIEGATNVDVLLACYDALAEDIRIAGEAAAAGDITMRCRKTQHAMLVLGHLEDWISLLEDADLEASLSEFYRYLRTELLRLQASVRSSDFTELAMRVCETRAVWQKKKSMSLPLDPTAHPQPDSDLAAGGRRLYCSA